VTAADQSVTTAEDTPVAITLTGSDVDGSALTFTIITAPTNGTLNGMPPTITYTPTTDFNGSDSFTFHVSNGALHSPPATVSITVVPVNDPPASTSVHIMTAEDATSQGVTPGVTDMDIATNGDMHTFVIESLPAHGKVAVIMEPQRQARITWDAVSHPHLAGYKLYYGFNSGNYAFTIDVGNQGSYSLTNMDPDHTYYFAVTAYAPSGDESPFSQELQYQAPHVGQLVYTPDPRFHGSDSFTYRAIDTEGSSVLGIADVTVSHVDHAPIASRDTVETAEDAVIVIGNVLANDTDVDGDPLEVSDYTSASHGTVVHNGDGTFTYTPYVDFNGLDSFIYTVQDGHGGTAVGLVSITVTPVADPLVAPETAILTSVGTAVDLTVPMIDADGDLLTLVGITQGIHGTVVTANETMHYMPAPDFHGQDSFTYTLNDGRGRTATSMVTVTVAYPPVAINDTVQTAEDTEVTTVNVLVNDIDAEEWGLVVSDYTLAAHGAVIDNDDGTFTYIPNANFNGSDSFTYTVTNSVGLSATATVTIIVTAVNDAPSTEDLQISVPVNTPVTILLRDHDVDGDPLFIALVSGAQRGYLSENLPLVTYTPEPNFIGQDRFTYAVMDPERLSATVTVTITVTGLVAAYGFNEGGGTTVQDASGHGHTGDIVGATRTPQGRFDAALAFEGLHDLVTIQDASAFALTTGMTLEAWVYPTGTWGGRQTILMKEQPGDFAYCLYMYDEAHIPSTGVFIEWGRELSSAVGLPADTWTHLAATYDGTVQRLYLNGVEVASQPQMGSIQGAPGQLRIGGNSIWGDYFHGRIDEVRLYNRTLTASEIRADMHLPVIPPAVTTAVDGPIDIVVLPNGASGGDNELTIVSVTPGTNGTVTINANGTLRYMPNPGFLGQDQFTYTVRDRNGDTATGSVTVKVMYAPVAGNDTVQTTEDTVVRTGNVLANDTDANGSPLRVSSFTSPAYGTVVSYGDGTFTYTPRTNFNGTDYFTYTVTNLGGLAATATVTVTVAAVNDAPVAQDLQVNTEKETAVTITLVGSDVDGDPLTFAIVVGPAQGTLSGIPPTLTYTPQAHFMGTDHFIYTVTDSGGRSAMATVTIAVTGLVAAYSFDEGSGTTVADASGNANDGTIIGAAWTTAGRFGPALSFNGATTAVTIADSSSLHSPSTAITVSAWIKPNNSDQAWSSLIQKMHASQAMSFALVQDYSHTRRLRGYLQVGGVRYYTAASKAMDNLTWYFVTLIWQSGQKVTLTLYNADGSVFQTVTTTASLSGTISYDNSPLYIGEDGAGENWKGMIDEVRIYNRALTTSELQRDMTTHVASPPVAAYSFDEGGGPWVADASDNVNHGTIFGATWSPEGRFSSALAFNGVDNWVTVNAAPSFDLTTGLTLEAWVFPTGTLATPGTVVAKEHLAGLVYFLQAGIGNYQPTTSVFIEGEQTLVGGASMVTNTWTHLAATYDGRMQRLYVNGDEVASRAQTGPIQGSADPFRLGGNSVRGEYFQGRIDEVRIYNRALTASEIRVNMNTPVAPPDTVTTSEDRVVEISVLPNGSATRGSMLTLASVNQGAHGSVAISAHGTMTYTPQPNFHGQDSFTYTVSDGNGGYATSPMSVIVTSVNDVPVAKSQTALTAEDKAVDLTLRGSDVDGDTLVFTLVTGPAHGYLSGTSTQMTYTPNVNFNGTDSFTFHTGDGTVISAPATVKITVTPMNDAPVAIGQSVTTPEDTAVSVTLSGSDVEGDSLTFAMVTGPTQGSLSGVPPQLIYTPNPNVHGTDSFIYTVTDGSGLSATAMVTVVVTPVNDTPVSIWASVTTAEDTPVAITLGGSDADGDALAYTILTEPANGTISGALPGVTYTPNSNFNGSDNFTFLVSDGTLVSTPATINITVTPVNDAPVTVGQSVTTLEDTAVSVTLSGSDIESDSLTFAIVRGPTQGSLSGAPPLLAYMPNPDIHGTDSFAYTVTDSGGLSSTATITVAVTPVNDAPVALWQSVTTAEDTPVAITLTGSDVDGDMLTFSIVTAPVNGTLSGTPPQVTYTPNADSNGPDSFTFHVSDGTETSAPVTIVINITPVNDPPTATSVYLVTHEDEVSSGVTPSVTDVDTATNGDIHTFVIVSQPANGVVSVVSAAQAGQVELSWQAVSYPNLAGYKLHYSHSSSTYEFVVDIGNQTTHTLTGLEQGQTYYFAVTAYDAFLNESSISQELSYQVPRVGQLIYTPNPNFHGLDSFTYLAIDSGDASVLGTAQVTVLPMNDAPVAVNDTVGTAEDTAVTTGNVLANDTDVEAGRLWVSGITPAAHGTVVYNGDGTFTYTPQTHFNGPDSFTYTVTDSEGLAATALVAVTVDAVSDTPVAEDIRSITPKDTTVTVLLRGSDAEDGPLTFAIAVGPQGSLSGTPPNLLYTPPANFVGTDRFTYRVTDDEGLSATATVIITVTDLVVAYSFTEGRGTTVADASNQANDGAIFGATWTSQGRFGSALAFDGPNAYVAVPAQPSLNITGALTLQAWIYPFVLEGAQTIVYKTSTGDLNSYDLALIGSAVGFGISTPDGWSGHITNGVNLVPNTWYHVAAVYNDATSNVHIYVDGVAVLSEPAVQALPANNGPLYIGTGYAGDQFRGRIDEVRLYNRALTAEEIQHDMATPVALPPVAAYSFDDGSGLAVTDASGNANHGTVLSATWSPQGRFGGALLFDGVNDWVTIEHTPSLALSTGLTLEAWVYPTATADGVHTVVAKEQPNGLGYFLRANSGTVPPATGVFVEGEQVLLGEASLPVNTWTHLAATYDGTRQRLHVNGVEVASRPQTGPIEGANHPLRIGGNSVVGEYFQGWIDEVRIYNRALSTSEIRADMYIPIAPPTPAGLEEDGILDIVLLPSGTAMGDNPPMVVSVGQGANGTVEILANGTVRYTPNPHFNGLDSFTYTVQDSRGGTATSVVRVMVTAVNDAPVALSQSVTTVEHTPVTITLTGSDRDEDTLTFSLVIGPTHGTVSGMPPLVTYMPNADFNGNDSFTFRVSDGTETSLPATVAITVMTARFVNGGFESGDFTGWSTIGETHIETAAFGSGPTEGNAQAFLSTAGDVEEPGNTVGNAVPIADLEAFLALPAGSLEGISTGTVVEGSAIKRTFTAMAGDVVSFDWNFLTDAFTNLTEPDFPAISGTNDFAFVTIVPNPFMPNLLADTFWTFSASEAEIFSETQFGSFSFTIPTTGTYTLGIGVVDVGHERVFSGLLLDNVALTPGRP
jgi:hypothetical protein